MVSIGDLVFLITFYLLSVDCDNVSFNKETVIVLPNDRIISNNTTTVAGMCGDCSPVPRIPCTVHDYSQPYIAFNDNPPGAPKNLKLDIYERENGRGLQYGLNVSFENTHDASYIHITGFVISLYAKVERGTDMAVRFDISNASWVSNDKFLQFYYDCFYPLPHNVPYEVIVYSLPRISLFNPTHNISAQISTPEFPPPLNQKVPVEECVSSDWAPDLVQIESNINTTLRVEFKKAPSSCAVHDYLVVVKRNGDHYTEKILRHDGFTSNIQISFEDLPTGTYTVKLEINRLAIYSAPCEVCEDRLHRCTPCIYDDIRFQVIGRGGTVNLEPLLETTTTPKSTDVKIAILCSVLFFTTVAIALIFFIKIRKKSHKCCILRIGDLEEHFLTSETLKSLLEHYGKETLTSTIDQMYSTRQMRTSEYFLIPAPSNLFNKDGEVGPLLSSWNLRGGKISIITYWEHNPETFPSNFNNVKIFNLRHSNQVDEFFSHLAIDTNGNKPAIMKNLIDCLKGIVFERKHSINCAESAGSERGIGSLSDFLDGDSYVCPWPDRVISGKEIYPSSDNYVNVHQISSGCKAQAISNATDDDIGYQCACSIGDKNCSQRENIILHI